MPNNCIVARETAAHYARMAVSDAIDEAVEQYAQDIRADHRDPGELGEAWSSLDDTQLNELSSLAKADEPDFALIGRLLVSASFEYWQKKSEEEAEKTRDDIMGAIMERKR